MLEAALREDIGLLAVVALHVGLTGLVATAGALVAHRAGLSRTLDLVAAAVLAPITFGWLAFWGHVVHPLAGRAVSGLVLVGVAAVIGAALVRRRAVLADLRALAVPGALVAAAVVLVVSVVFLYGGADDPLATPAIRWTHQLPDDNGIPFALASALWRGENPPDPITGDYQSSDRPPLQAGMFLAVRPATALVPAGDGLHYQAFGVVAQLLFLASLHVLLQRARVRPAPAALVLAAVIACSVTFVHGAFVWPKLLPLAPLLLIVAYLFADERDVRTSALAGAVCGLCAAAAVLGHGGSAFALAGIGIVLTARRRLPSARFVAVAVVAVAVVVGPWEWYRAVEQPPGNRLEKWHLAGVVERDERSTLDALVDAYGDLAPSTVAEHKAANVGSLLGPLAGYRAVVDGDRSLEQALTQVRDLQFAHYLPALGVFAFGPLALLASRGRGRSDTAERRAATWALACVGAGVTVWVLVLFGPGTAVVHHGSLLFIVLAIAGSILAFWAWSPRAAVAAVAVSVVSTLTLYLVAPPSSPDGGAALAVRDDVHPLLAITVAASLALIVWLLWRMAGEDQPHAVAAGAGGAGSHGPGHASQRPPGAWRQPTE